MSLNGFIRILFGDDVEKVEVRRLPPKGTAWRAMIEAKREAATMRQETRRLQHETARLQEIELFKRTMVTPQPPVRYEDGD